MVIPKIDLTNTLCFGNLAASIIEASTYYKYNHKK